MAFCNWEKMGRRPCGKHIHRLSYLIPGIEKFIKEGTETERV